MLERHYIPRESNKTLTYYGPYETEDHAWVTDALTSSEADLSSREAAEQTVRVQTVSDDELAYVEDDPSSIGFRAVKIRPADKVPVHNYFVRSPKYVKRKISCGEIDQIVNKCGKTKEGFFQWLEGPATAWQRAGGSDLVAQGIAALDDIGALLEEEQDLVPLDVDEVVENAAGTAESLVIDDWETDDALELAASRMLRDG